MSTTKRLVSDELWRIVEPLLPSDIPWRILCAELGYGSGATCWRRLRDWQKAGVWRQHVLVGKGRKRVGASIPRPSFLPSEFPRRTLLGSPVNKRGALPRCTQEGPEPR
jgi:hypothetical protein